MKNSDDSWRHHSFPVALQKYWRTGENICWLDGGGQPRCKKFGRKATGWIKHGHKIILDQPWGTGEDAITGYNFEQDFESVDNQIPGIVNKLLELRSNHYSVKTLVSVLRFLILGKRKTLPIGEKYKLPQTTHRALLELLFSLVNRSTYYRQAMASCSVFDDVAARDQVGKSNMRTNFLRDSEIARIGPIENHRFLALFDPTGKFVFPDGLPHWIIMRANDQRIWGRLLVPLTPELVIYFSTPDEVPEDENLISLLTPPQVREGINQVLMLYAQNKTYFAGTSPIERPDHPLEEIWSIDPNFDPTIRLLDKITGYKEPATIEGLRKALADHFTRIGAEKSAGGEVTLPHGYAKRDQFDDYKSSHSK